MQLHKAFSLISQITQTVRNANVCRLGFLMALMLMPLIAAACGSEDENIVLTRGRSLEIWLKPPIVLDKLSYTDTTGIPRVLRARASNRQLAVVDVTVVNRTSIITPMLIDSDAAKRPVSSAHSAAKLKDPKPHATLRSKARREVRSDLSGNIYPPQFT